jgi:hypothetical protein
MWGAISDKRMDHLQLLLALASAVIFGSESRETHMTIFYCPQIQDSPNLEGQVPIFISSRNRMAQLNLQALGFLFVTSYDSRPNCLLYNHFARTE